MATVFAVPTVLEAPRGFPPAALTAVPISPRVIAPHVMARITAVCERDTATAAQIAAALTPAQRAGLSALPDPLPLVAGIRDPHGAAVLDEDRRILLTAAVCVDDRVEILLDACDITMARLLRAPAVAALTLVAGRFRFADQRMRILAHEASSIAERTAAHRSLARQYEDRGESECAVWHRALSAMEGDGSLTAPLLRLAAAQLEAGQAEQAHATAREAASHAEAADIDAARELAGRAALNAGWLDDAIAWLTPVVTSTGATRTAQQALAVAGVLRHGAPAWLTSPIDTDELEVLTGRWDRIAASSRDQEQDRTPLERALRLALDDDVHGALSILTGPEPPHTEHGPPDPGTIGPGPLLRAHREVMAALLLTWHGDLGEARRRLERAAETVPLALPFRGLAVRLARRLELATDGYAGDLSSTLQSVSPLPRAQDQPLERATVAYLSGRSDEAAVHLRAWTDRRRREADVGLPGLDEVGPLRGPALVQPGDITRASELRRRIRATACPGGDELAAIESDAASIASPFERGRISALLGTAEASRGDRAGAARHLRAAIGMLADAGAHAWRCAVEGRLARLGEQPNVDVRTPTTPIPVCTGDPLAVCRSAWQPLLTGRELEIAMLIAEGASNRGIADQLHLSVRTIEVNAGRIFRKFGVRSRGELTALAHRTNVHA